MMRLLLWVGAIALVTHGAQGARQESQEPAFGYNQNPAGGYGSYWGGGGGGSTRILAPSESTNPYVLNHGVVPTPPQVSFGDTRRRRFGDTRRRRFGDTRRRRFGDDRRRAPKPVYVAPVYVPPVYVPPPHGHTPHSHDPAAGERREKEEQQAMEAQQKQNEAEEAAERATKEKADKTNAAEVDHKGEQAGKAENAAKQQAAADENAQKATERTAKAAESDEKTAAAERLRKDEEAAERAAKEKEDKAAIEEAELKAWERTDKSEKAGKAAAERAAKDAVIEAAAKEEARQAERAIKVSAELAAKAAAAAEKAYKQDGSEKAHKSYSEKMDKSSVMQPTPPPTPVYSGCHAGGWFKPTSVAKATCTSVQRPSYDPMAMGGEPAGTCEQDESGNAAKLLAGGETFLRAASGSGKVYSFAYAFDSASWIDELHLEGRSTGAMAAHNDNRFYATFSTDGELWSDEHAIADCQDLSHGKCTLRLSKQVKMSYVKLIVRSSCTGCNNADYVKSLRVKCAASGIVASALTSPTCAPVPERCTLQGVPSLRLGSDTCAWGLVQLGPQGLRFSASKCVSRRNFCGAQRDTSCGASVAPVASRLTITTTGSAKSYVNLHEDGTVDFEVPNGGCVEHIAAAPKVSKGAHFQDPTRGSDAYIMYEETGSVGLKLYTQGLDIDCTAVSGGGVSIKK